MGMLLIKSFARFMHTIVPNVLKFGKPSTWLSHKGIVHDVKLNILAVHFPNVQVRVTKIILMSSELS